MKPTGLICGLALGLGLGAFAAVLWLGQPKPVFAAGNDRHDDFILATGAVNINPKLQTDGVWLLDYKSGKLLGTVIDKALGKIIDWAEVDLVSEFEIAPKTDVHFLMTTGWVSQGQSALYLAETTTGKFGVYTMGPGPNGTSIVIRRHDVSAFRAAKQAAVEPPKVVPGAVAPAGPAAPVAPAPKLPPIIDPLKK